MLTVHHLENSRSQRILWLLEELGVDYAIKRYARDPLTSLAPPELTAVHPLGKSPVVTDGERTIAESGAIVEFLLDHHGAGRLRPPAGSAAFDQYRYWLHFSEGSFMPLMVMSLIFNRVATAKMPFFAKPIARSIVGKVRQSYIDPNTRRALDFMETSLSATGWFAGGELSAADIQMSFPVEAAAVRSGLGEHYPNLQSFLDRIHSRPAYQAALEKGGPYALLGGQANSSATS
ncbi:MAG: glutathione S-transferase [Woeseia sp.]